MREMIEALGRAIGRPIRYVAITDEQWGNAVKERLNPHALDHLTHLWQYFRKGEGRYQATDTIRAVTGGRVHRRWKSSSGRMPTLSVPRLNETGFRPDRASANQQEVSMSPQILFQIHLVLGYVAWLLCFGVYFGPGSSGRGRSEAHRAIATLHSFRFFGLVFILPGIVGPNLPASFATFAAYGDFATGVLAMLALLTVRIRPLFWLFVVAFNLVGRPTSSSTTTTLSRQAFLRWPGNWARPMRFRSSTCPC